MARKWPSEEIHLFQTLGVAWSHLFLCRISYHLLSCNPYIIGCFFAYLMHHGHQNSVRNIRTAMWFAVCLMYMMFKNHDIYSNMYLLKAHVKHIVLMKYFIIVLCPLSWSASVYNFNKFWGPTQILETIMCD